MRACARRPAVFPVNEWTSGSEPGQSDGACLGTPSEQDCDHDSVQVELQSRWERQGFCGKGGCAGRSQVETKTFVSLQRDALTRWKILDVLYVGLP